MEDAIELKVNKAVGRLKILQAELRDRGGDSCQRHLERELKRQIKGIPRQRRRTFLKRVARNFPVFDGGVEGDVSRKSGEGQDPVERALKACEEVEDERKAELKDRLAQRGIAVQKTEEEKRLERLLQETELSHMEPAELVEVVSELSDFIIKLDGYLKDAWEELGPEGEPYPAGVRTALNNYLSDEGNRNGRELSRSLTRLYRTAVILLVVQRAIERFASEYCETYSPEAVERIARMENKNWLESWEHKFWTKYVEVAEDLDQRTIRSDFMNIYRETVARLHAAGGQEG